MGHKIYVATVRTPLLQRLVYVVVVLICPSDGAMGTAMASSDRG
jgi:hypothetical protein